MKTTVKRDPRLEHIEQFSVSALHASRHMLDENRDPNEVIGMLTATLCSMLLAIHALHNGEHTTRGTLWVEGNKDKLRQVFSECFAQQQPDLDFMIQAIHDGVLIFDKRGNLCSEYPLVTDSAGGATIH